MNSFYFFIGKFGCFLFLAGIIFAIGWPFATLITKPVEDNRRLLLFFRRLYWFILGIGAGFLFFRFF